MCRREIKDFKLHLYFQRFPNCPRRFKFGQFCENFENTPEINP